MRDLVQGKAEVDQDTIMLINATEVLTKDGICGRIANIGVGFGTGRHTMKRKSPSPLAGKREQN
jgi:hypothetical protein